MRVVFDVIDTHRNKTRYEFDKGEYLLGKGDQCDVLLNDSHVSRSHAVLKISSRQVVIEDLGSTNGTWFQGAPLESQKKVELEDVFQFGQLQLKFFEISSPRQKLDLLLKQDSKEIAVQNSGDSEELIEIKRRIHGMILDYLDLRKRSDLQELTAEQLRIEAEKATREIVSEHIRSIPPEITREQLIDQVVGEAVGLGALEPFLADETITEVMVNGPDQIYVERSGRLELSGSRFTSRQSLMGVIDRIVAPLGRRIDESSPMVDARLPDGSRVNAIIPPLSLIGPTLTVRKFSKKKLAIQDLVDYETLTVEMAIFLKSCVENKKNLIVSGGTGSGKTTTLNILSSFIGAEDRIVTIEDAAELKLHQPHVVSLESRPANAEGKGQITIRDLVINALRMRPDRIVVGECRSGEALDMLQAMNTGHDGSLTTGHANSPRDFLARLEVMVLMAGVDLPVRAIREQIASAVDIIIQQTRMADGARRITDIVEVRGIDDDSILLTPIFQFQRTGITSKGKIEGHFTPSGEVPVFYQELQNAGLDMDFSIFMDEDEVNGLPNETSDEENIWS